MRGFPLMGAAGNPNQILRWPAPLFRNLPCVTESSSLSELMRAGARQRGAPKMVADGVRLGQLLPASSAALAVVSDGVVALGRDGEPDAGSGGVGVPGVGRPAAWWSSDGDAWIAAKVEGIAAAGAQLTEAFRVEDGYFAVGSDTTTLGQNARSPLLWISTDARDWRLLGPPAQWGRAGSNGRQAVIFSRTEFGTVKLGGWSSQDGHDWIQMTFSGDVGHVPGYEPAVGQTRWVDRIFVMDRGIVVMGQSDGQLTAWFAEAVSR